MSLKGIAFATLVSSLKSTILNLLSNDSRKILLYKEDPLFVSLLSTISVAIDPLKLESLFPGR